MSPDDLSVPLSFRVDAAFHDRVERLQVAMSRPLGTQLSRSTVLRTIVMRGLASLEETYAKDLEEMKPKRKPKRKKLG